MLADPVLAVIARIQGAALKAADRMGLDLRVEARTIVLVEKEVRKAEVQPVHVDRMDHLPHEEIQIGEDRKVEVPRDNADQTVHRRGVRVRIAHLAITMDAAIEVPADRRTWIAIDEAAIIADKAIGVDEARRSRIADLAREDLRGCNEDRSVDHNPDVDLRSEVDLHSDAVDLVVRRWARRG